MGLPVCSHSGSCHRSILLLDEPVLKIAIGLGRSRFGAIERTELGFRDFGRNDRVVLFTSAKNPSLISQSCESRLHEPSYAKPSRSVRANDLAQ